MKIRCFENGSYEYFEHCPFCGSVAVDFDQKKFRCPDCGAIVTFELREEECRCDGPTDSEKYIHLWNRRKGREITADDLCVMAQKTTKDKLLIYQREIRNKVWSYVIETARLGKFSCEIPKKYINPDYYNEKGFDVTELEDSYHISWEKEIKWDYE